jgi:hypothetical protein
MKRLALVVAALGLTACTPAQAIDAVFHDDRATAHRIARCESNYDPHAVSHTGDHGLFQINAATWNKPGHADPVADWIGRHWHRRYDPVINAVMARKIRDRYGWRMWACA